MKMKKQRKPSRRKKPAGKDATLIAQSGSERPKDFVERPLPPFHSKFEIASVAAALISPRATQRNVFADEIERAVELALHLLDVCEKEAQRLAFQHEWVRAEEEGKILPFKEGVIEIVGDEHHPGRAVNTTYWKFWKWHRYGIGKTFEAQPIPELTSDGKPLTEEMKRHFLEQDPWWRHQQSSWDPITLRVAKLQFQDWNERGRPDAPKNPGRPSRGIRFRAVDPSRGASSK
jgi:hypothetical protein